MTTAFLRYEVRRVLRNPRTVMFTMLMPVLLYFAFGSGADHEHLSGIGVPAYIMVSMATFGMMSTVFSVGGRIGLERAIGWNRQLRLTGLTGGQYVTGKLVAGYLVGVGSLLSVFVVAHFHGGVDLSAGRWLSVALSIALALLPVGALGIWFGYLVKPDSLQAVSGIVYSVLSLLGGLWVPIENFPHALAVAVKVLPMYWVPQAGREAVVGSWVGWTGAAVLLAWASVLAGLAARAYRSEASRA